MIQVRVKEEGLSGLLARVRGVSRDASPVLRAMGNTLKSITEGTFNSAGSSYRPAPWAPKRDGTPSNLQRSTTMAKAFFLEVHPRRAVVGNPVRYAAIHQMGGTIVPVEKKALHFMSGGRAWTVSKVVIPARPFFPILSQAGDTEFTARAERLIVRAGERALAAVLLGPQGAPRPAG